MTDEQNAEPKGTLYTNMLQLLNSRVELLDEPRSIAQLCSLERRTARSGRDSIDHPPGGHDDLINAVAGVAVGCISPSAAGLSLVPAMSRYSPVAVVKMPNWKSESRLPPCKGGRARCRYTPHAA